MVKLVRCNIRAVDAVARYGGDEFCILLPEAGASQACQVAKKIQAAIAAHIFPHGRLTASLGLVCGRAIKDLTAEALIAQADEALYTAKREGRNRTVCLPARQPESDSPTAIAENVLTPKS